jgi:fatty-acyl-CoA synthase
VIRKDVIFTGGENVSSVEVEDVLFSHPAVAEVAVT